MIFSSASCSLRSIIVLSPASDRPNTIYAMTLVQHRPTEYPAIILITIVRSISGSYFPGTIGHIRVINVNFKSGPRISGILNKVCPIWICTQSRHIKEIIREIVTESRRPNQEQGKGGSSYDLKYPRRCTIHGRGRVPQGNLYYY